MLPVLVAALLGQADAGAAAPPGSEWSGLPGETVPAMPPAAAEVGPPPSINLPMPPTIEEPLLTRGLPLTYRLDPPNKVSLYGARPLGPGRRAVALVMGFPLLGGRALMGVTPKLDLGLSYETLYGLMHDLRAAGRWLLWTEGGMSLGVLGDAGVAFFLRPATSDVNGARWLTGRRNFNGSGGLVLSIQGSAPRASRFFMSGRCLLAVDTHPVQSEPLGGAPGPVVVTPNVLTEIGLEAPVSEWVSLAFRVGLDIHGRPDDSAVMVTGAAGVVTALP